MMQTLLTLPAVENESNDLKLEECTDSDKEWDNVKLDLRLCSNTDTGPSKKVPSTTAKKMNFGGVGKERDEKKKSEAIIEAGTIALESLYPNKIVEASARVTEAIRKSVRNG
jgi:hypothetical protein